MFVQIHKFAMWAGDFLFSHIGLLDFFFNTLAN